MTTTSRDWIGAYLDVFWPEQAETAEQRLGGVMNDKKYSIEEIDAMRKAVAWLVMHELGDGLFQQWQSGMLAGDAIMTEDRLRTYLLNGTRPSELRDAIRRCEAT